jgi:tetratricopeptide (TPR) repeat protein
VISIDNIGLTIWGWILAGALVGASYFPDTNDASIKFAKKEVGNSSTTALKPVLSGILSLLMVVTSSIIFRSETDSIKTRILFNSNSSNQSDAFYKSLDNLLSLPLTDNAYKFEIATLLGGAGQTERALKIIDSILNEDARCLDCLIYKALIYESRQDFVNATKTRNKIIILDPWNAKNYLEVIKGHMALGEKDKALAIYFRMEEFAQSTIEYELAKKEVS